MILLHLLTYRHGLSSFHLHTSIRSNLLNVDWLGLSLVHFLGAQRSNLVLSRFLWIVAFSQLLSKIITTNLRLLYCWPEKLLLICFFFQSLHCSFIRGCTTLNSRFMIIVLGSPPKPSRSFGSVEFSTFSCNYCWTLPWFAWYRLNSVKIESRIFKERCQRIIVSVTSISVMSYIFLTIFIWRFPFVKSRLLRPMVLNLREV